ncbi:SixA phosphatase family protein [Chryseosolibacter indicus]|uniref:Histidine phosphatase family protein n=1 Tax=Chryseosolibacter indicus TaxID=2782351 RepID=A0ABS5VRX3_9BACT|nr:histidine phosphatase family protein [Chryseosolibacter indicus]MBT1704178.1 histidine phosphatase family protein [Chryseosolibacter indicus]
MKTLYIVRHAKSSWADPEQNDFERPLNERGKRDAPRMGKRLKEKGIVPDIIVSSPAKRAKSTAKKIAKVLGYSKEKISKITKLYHATDDEILGVLKTIKDIHSNVIVVGHNPGLTDFANALIPQSVDIDNIPTCGIVAISFDVTQWRDITWGQGKFLFFDYPKSKED